MTHTRFARAGALGALSLFVALFAACGDGSAAAEGGEAAPTAEPVATGDASPSTGNVIEVEMHADRFEPSTVEARPGDVLRFVNVQDVHNISWPAGKNPNGASLPTASPFLTAPGQTHDVHVTMSRGEYHFQCDPHVPMGMVGTLNVVD